MSKRKIFDIIIIFLSLFMVVNLFLTCLSINSVSYSLWTLLGTGEKTIFIVYAVFNILFCVFDLTNLYNKIEVCFISGGFYFTYFLSNVLSLAESSTLSQSGIAIWIGLIFGLAILVMAFVSSLQEVVKEPKKEKVKEPAKPVPNQNPNMPNQGVRNFNNYNNMNTGNYNFNQYGPYNNMNNPNMPNQGMMYPNNNNNFRR